MTVPKWFKKWFSDYGLDCEDLDFYDCKKAERIAWRAYRKGKKDCALETIDKINKLNDYLIVLKNEIKTLRKYL